MKYGLALALVILSALAFATDEPGKSDPAKGQQIATQVCAACHGADGNSTVPAYPRLAGQHAGYIATQLSYFKAGTRKNPIMQGFAAAFSPEDMKNLGAYFENQAPRLQSAKDKALAEQGQRLYRGGNVDKGLPACTACHGPNGAGMPAQYPRLAGQHADYVFAQLKAYSSGERSGGDTSIMKGVVVKLSELEMKALAEYIAGLR